MNLFKLARKTTRKSIKVHTHTHINTHTIISLMFFVLISYNILSVEAKELKCLTGYKILTR
jgi:hypothetical protein